MADTQDICDRIDADLSPLLASLAGKTIVPTREVDQARYPGITVPKIISAPGRPLLIELENRLESGRGLAAVFADPSVMPHKQPQNQQFVYPGFPTTPKLTIAVVGNACTIGGTIQAGDTVGLQAGPVGAGYGVQTGDNLAAVAAGLAANANLNAIPTSVVGVVVTVNLNIQATFAIGANESALLPQWYRRKAICCDLMVPDDFQRQYVGKQIEVLYGRGTRLTMPDGSDATIVSMDSFDMDSMTRTGNFIRRFRWVFDFCSTTSVSATEVVATTLTPVVLPDLGQNEPFTPPRPGQL